MKEYRVVYKYKDYTNEAGQNGWIPSEEIAKRILANMQKRPFYRNDTLFLETRERKTSESYTPCRTKEGKTVFNTDYFYCDALQIGDLVEKEIVDQFINCLPPACMRADCSQLGEAKSTRIDENGCIRNTYLTFKQIDADTWEYCGECFRGENVQTGKPIPYI